MTPIEQSGIKLDLHSPHDVDPIMLIDVAFPAFLVLMSFQQVFAQNDNDSKLLLPSGGSHLNFIVDGWLPSQYTKIEKTADYDITPPCKVDDRIVCNDMPMPQNTVTRDNEVDVKVSTNGHYAGGFYSTDKVIQKLGSYQTTMKFSDTPEVRYSFFLYDNSTANEIDIIEADMSHCWFFFTCITMSSTIHQGYYTGSGELDHKKLWNTSKVYLPWEFAADKFHTYALKWENNNLQFQIDGKKYYNSDQDVNLNATVIKEIAGFSNMRLYVNSYAFEPIHKRPTDDSVLQVISISKN